MVLPAVDDPANAGQQAQPRYEYAYDIYGNQVSIKDPSQNETRFTYDQYNRQLTRELPLGVETTGDPTDFLEQHFSDDTPIATVQAGPTPERSTGAGQLDHTIDFQGRVTAFFYDNTTDGSGRLIEKRFYANETDYSTDTYESIVTYKHDAFGRMVDVNDSVDGITTYSYDADGRQSQIAAPQGTLDYTFDSLGRLTDTVSAHTDTQYVHDELGRIITVTTTKQLGQTLASADDTNYFYDLVGNLDHIVYDSGVVVDYTYDTLYRLDLLTRYAPENGGGDPNDFTDNEIITSFAYALNADGLRASVTETRDGGQAGTGDDLVTTITWTYGNINRLIEEVYSGVDAVGAALDYTTTYTFDLVSNRLTMAKDTDSDGSAEDTTTYTYDANDRLLTETLDSTTNPDDRHTVYEGLDDTGTIREQTSFTYNARGRIASTTIDRFDGTGTLTSSTQTEYIYNDPGIRTQQIVRTDGDGT